VKIIKQKILAFAFDVKDKVQLRILLCKRFLSNENFFKFSIFNFFIFSSCACVLLPEFVLLKCIIPILILARLALYLLMTAAGSMFYLVDKLFHSLVLKGWAELVIFRKSQFSLVIHALCPTVTLNCVLTSWRLNNTLQAETIILLFCLFSVKNDTWLFFRLYYLVPHFLTKSLKWQTNSWQILLEFL